MRHARFLLLLAAAFACAPSAPSPPPRATPATRDALLAALSRNPQDFAAMVQLGIVYEGLGQFDEALAAYRRADAMRVTDAERRAVQQRMAALTRVRLASAAREAVAAEQSLGAVIPTPNTIAVLPWTYLGSRTELKPLERGLAHLVVTDLAKVSRFTLLERERVQLIVAELALGAGGRIDPATAVRSGRLLRAERVVQGSIRETGAATIRLDALMLSTTTAEPSASGTASDRLAELFSMEKSLVLQLLDRLGVSLTPAEQRAIAERPTADLQAFLAFSRGLEAEDRGEFAAAARQYAQAASRDPAFAAARERAALSIRAGDADHMTTARLARSLQGQRIDPRARAGATPRAAQLAAALQSIAPTLAGRLAQKPGKLAVARGRLAEALRQDDLGRLGNLGKLVTTIPRP